jgi:hypothetical protein
MCLCPILVTPSAAASAGNGSYLQWALMVRKTRGLCRSAGALRIDTCDGECYYPRRWPVVPCLVRLRDGSGTEVCFVVKFREIQGRTSCVVAGTCGKQRELSPEELNQ